MGDRGLMNTRVKECLFIREDNYVAVWDGNNAVLIAGIKKSSQAAIKTSTGSVAPALRPQSTLIESTPCSFSIKNKDDVSTSSKSNTLFSNTSQKERGISIKWLKGKVASQSRWASIALNRRMHPFSSADRRQSFELSRQYDRVEGFIKYNIVHSTTTSRATGSSLDRSLCLFQ